MVDKLIHDIEQRGNLFYLINAFIGSYNRRTDALLKIAATDPAEIARLAEKLKSSTDALEKAVESQGE